ncbi:MAG TPA: hypothetical protein VKQ28_07305 [Candidatus Acidoferrum sp.]|nr:hypothetical protein [Candidatus Acidoferrum sp.]
MMPSSFADKAIARILDLSADLQIQRRTTAPGSPIFLTAEPAIVAYGRALEVLTTLQQQEEYRAPMDLLGPLARAPEFHAIL